MDGFSQILNNATIGCSINGHFVNHLIYAADCCIITPSPAGLQSLLDMCLMYADSISIVYNEIKTKCMCFRRKPLRNLFLTILL